MSSPSLSWALAVALLLSTAAMSQSRELRVCADPDNLPFSNMKRQGFENQIAELVAGTLKAHLIYVWQRMGRGFVREYLSTGKCDLLIGVPTNYRPVLTTVPYYRSTFVFVSRRNEPLIDSFDSPQLRRLKIGVQVLEEDYTPPGHALARRGLQSDIVGFETTGKEAGSIIEAVAEHKVDIAVVWGPLAGYFAQRYRNVLQMHPVVPEADPPGLPFTFSISMGVRKGNASLRDELNSILGKHSREIRAILTNYGVPQLPLNTELTESSALQ
jgi:mxaJ protein